MSIAPAAHNSLTVLTVGGAMLDTIALIDSELIERMSMVNADRSFLLLEEGRKTEALKVSSHCGGGAVNVAVALARLGHRVSTLIKIGIDDRAAVILSALQQEGVDCRWIVQERDAPTGASVHLASHDRNAAVFTFRGANTLLQASDLVPAAFDAKLVYISTLSDQSAACFPEIVRLAKENGAMVATNPGIRQLSARGVEFAAALPDIDILIMNRTEAEALVPLISRSAASDAGHAAIAVGDPRPHLMSRGLTSGGYSLSFEQFAEALVNAGLKVLLLTDGLEGAFASTGDGITFCPALKTNVVGTAGAGDAFAATFAAFFAAGAPTQTALQAAAVNAASVVRFADTQTGLLTTDRIGSDVRAAEHQLDVRHWPRQLHAAR